MQTYCHSSAFILPSAFSVNIYYKDLLGKTYIAYNVYNAHIHDIK